MSTNFLDILGFFVSFAAAEAFRFLQELPNHPQLFSSEIFPPNGLFRGYIKRTEMNYFSDLNHS